MNDVEGGWPPVKSAVDARSYAELDDAESMQGGVGRTLSTFGPIL